MKTMNGGAGPNSVTTTNGFGGSNHKTNGTSTTTWYDYNSNAINQSPDTTTRRKDTIQPNSLIMAKETITSPRSAKKRSLLPPVDKVPSNGVTANATADGMNLAVPAPPSSSSAAWKDTINSGELTQPQQQVQQSHPLLRPPRQSPGGFLPETDLDEVLLTGINGDSIRLQIPRSLPNLPDYHSIPKPPKPNHRNKNRNGTSTSASIKAAHQMHNDFVPYHHRRKASLTPEEEYVLHCIFVDPPKRTANDETPFQVTKPFNDDILFSVPDESDFPRKKEELKKPPPPKRRSIQTLWEAHAAGVAPKELKRLGSRTYLKELATSSDSLGQRRLMKQQSSRSRLSSKDDASGSFRRNASNDGLNSLPPRPGGDGSHNMKKRHRRIQSGGAAQQHQPPIPHPPGALGGHRRIRSTGTGKRSSSNSHKRTESDGSAFSFASLFGTDSSLDVPSDEEVRRDDEDDRSECSSWGESECERDFNPWEVLKNEYAKDFGFDYQNYHKYDADRIITDSASSGGSHNAFLILGTSADDKSAQPHVLSPPLMDALIDHLPNRLMGENMWLKFSLIRDGACLDTMKRYVRAPSDTIIAIETDRGEVFGCYTSHPWRTCPGFFGTAPAFVWKLKHGRRSRCSSLFDQAQLESEIEVFPFTGGGNYVQVCKNDLLAVGGDESHETDFMRSGGSIDSDMEMSGFAIALEDDLLRGTTSPSHAFNNPSLCGFDEDRTQVFYVSGLEVWTLTPARDVDTAEKLEMSKYFVEQSTRSIQMGSPRGSSYSQSPGNPGMSQSFRGSDLIQSEFYKRVGHDPDGDERRQRWQYRNMMDGGGGATRAFGATPRFGYG